jgi:hypothetical protein
LQAADDFDAILAPKMKDKWRNDIIFARSTFPETAAAKKRAGEGRAKSTKEQMKKERKKERHEAAQHI